MNEMRQAVFGILAAVLSSVILLGSLAVALAEDGQSQAIAPIPTSWPTSTPLVNTTAPGEPTYTSSPTSLPTATPTYPPPSTNCPPPPGWVPYVVQPDDTLAGLARAFGVTFKALAQANCLISSVPTDTIIFVPAPLPTDTNIPISTNTPTPIPPPPTQTSIPCGPPPGWVIYILQPGDNLYRLGVEVGASIYELQRANCLTGITIRAGQRFYVPRLPVRTPVPSPTLQPSPTEPILPTNTATRAPTATHEPSSTPRPLPSNTPVPPTATFTPTPEPPTTTFTPTNAPTETPLPSPTPKPPTGTFTPTLPPTFTPPEPTPTEAVRITPSPLQTDSSSEDLSTNP